jgi:hypothetical protein
MKVRITEKNGRYYPEYNVADGSGLILKPIYRCFYKKESIETPIPIYFLNVHEAKQFLNDQFESTETTNKRWGNVVEEFEI